jgi:dephospho-CoA kinase
VVGSSWSGGRSSNIFNFFGHLGHALTFSNVGFPHSSPETQLQRLISRDSARLTEADARSRIAAQASLSKKLQYADTVIDNSGPLDSLKVQVDGLVEDLRKQAGWSWRLDWLIPPLGIARGLIRILWRLWIVRVGSDRRQTKWSVESGKLKVQ